MQADLWPVGGSSDEPVILLNLKEEVLESKDGFSAKCGAAPRLPGVVAGMPNLLVKQYRMLVRPTPHCLTSWTHET